MKNIKKKIGTLIVLTVLFACAMGMTAVAKSIGNLDVYWDGPTYGCANLVNAAGNSRYCGVSAGNSYKRILK